MSKKDEIETASDKLGYTWYPRHWWGSDTFFDVDDLLIRGVIREIFDLMSMDSTGTWKENRKNFQKMMRYTFTDDQWTALKSCFKVQTFDGIEGEFWSHSGVLKRKKLSPAKVLANQENGKLGGRPKTQITQENNPTETHENPNNPPYKNKVIESKDKLIELKPLKGVDSSMVSADKSTPTPVGDRFDLKEFVERAGVTFNSVTIGKAGKLWDKLTDAETKLATKWFRGYRQVMLDQELQPKFSDYLKSKPWIVWEENFQADQTRIRESEKNQNDVSDENETN